MEKSRHGSKRSKEKQSRRKKHGRRSGDSVVTKISDKRLVEYSDVSSEDLSGPEAGEIQSEDSVHSVSDCEIVADAAAVQRELYR